MNKEELFVAFELFAQLSSSIPTFSSTSHSSILRVGTWDVVSENDNKYLVAMVQSNVSVHSTPSLSSTSSSHNIEDLEEEHLNFDCSSKQDPNQDRKGSSDNNSAGRQVSYDSHIPSLLTGEFHIVYHPMYQIPCPYLRIQNSNGELTTAQHYSQLIGVLDPAFELFEEFHPILYAPYICPHICSIKDKLNMMTLNEISENCNDCGSGNNDQRMPRIDSMFIAKYLTVVGPMVGLCLDPAEYVLLEKETSKINHRKN